jgi:DNA-binding XRE family transcriptional regulator
MGYQLQMSEEIHDWLAALTRSNPPAAALVGQALTALLSEGASLGPPVVVALGQPPSPDELPEALDQSYQDRLEAAQIVRRLVVETAVLGQDIQLQIHELESLRAQLTDHRPGPADGPSAPAGPSAPDGPSGELAAVTGQLASLRKLLAGVTRAEEQLTRQGQGHQLGTDAFRTRKEVLKAAYHAEQATRAIDQAFAGSGLDTGEARPQQGSPDAVVTDTIAEIAREAELELGPGPAEGLLELRPGSPGKGKIRIIFAVEPPGTALLIAVLQGRKAVRDHRSEAVMLSAAVLRQARAGQAPEAAAHAFADAPSFLREFFPSGAAEIEAGAAALAASTRARALADQRSQLGLTQEQVAHRMGVRPERVSAIERAGPGTTEVRTLASYVAALGGRLEVVADFDGERVLLG